MQSPDYQATSPATPTQVDHAYTQLLALLDGLEQGPHTRLAGEETLARQFGVSRPVLRQALMRLRTEGRIYSRKGAGHYVAEMGARGPTIVLGTLASLADVRSFLDFRCSLEGESARLAAGSRDRHAISKIQKARRRMEMLLAAGEPGIQQDIAFHVAIAHATSNRFLRIPSPHWPSRCASAFAWYGTFPTNRWRCAAPQ